MTPMQRVRKSVLGLSQSELARIAQVSQGTVSKWETGELEPGRDELGRIRDAARARGIAWDDRWFFEPPPLTFAEGEPEPERAA
jgi:transcriptional regulator with XRE-family HTH domain